MGIATCAFLGVFNSPISFHELAPTLNSRTVFRSAPFLHPPIKMTPSLSGEVIMALFPTVKGNSGPVMYVRIKEL